MFSWLFSIIDKGSLLEDSRMDVFQLPRVKTVREPRLRSSAVEVDHGCPWCSVSPVSDDHWHSEHSSASPVLRFDGSMPEWALLGKMTVFRLSEDRWNAQVPCMPFSIHVNPENARESTLHYLNTSLRMTQTVSTGYLDTPKGNLLHLICCNEGLKTLALRWKLKRKLQAENPEAGH